MQMDKDLLDDVLEDLRRHRGDSTTVEIKRASGGMPDRMGASICAFANMPDGGHIILGVSEPENFSITGVEDPAQAEAALISIAREAVTPSPYIETHTIDDDGMHVVTARVASLSPALKPARFRGDAYLRQADGDYVMGPADMRMLEIAKLHETERIQYDSAPVSGARSEDLDHDIVDAFLRRARAASTRLRGLDDLTLLRQLGATSSSGEPTVAGLYALGNFPQGLLPSLQVTAAVQLPRDGGSARTQNLRYFDGPLPDLLNDALGWVVTNLTTRQVYRPDGHLRDEPEMPLRAIREALANALVHRDLGPDTIGTGRSVDVRITNRALTIVSPGGLQGVTLSQITSSAHARAAVNQRLYAIAKHLRTPDGQKIIEGEGGGVTEILRSTVESDLHRPRLVDNGVQFTAVLWRGSAFTEEDARWLDQVGGGRPLTHMQKQVLLRARDGQRWDADRMREEFSPLPREDAQDQLSDLVRWRLVDADLADDVPVRIFDDQLTSASSPPAEHPESTTERRNGSEERIADSGPNAAAVWAAMGSGGTTVSALRGDTGLSARQVRYALNRMMQAGLVAMDGGQGHRSTTYRRLPPGRRRPRPRADPRHVREAPRGPR